MVPNVSLLSYLLHYSILRYRYRTATVIIQQLWAFTTNSIFSANETIFFLPFVTNFWCLCFKIYLLFLSLQIFDFWISFRISEILFVQELRLKILITMCYPSFHLSVYHSCLSLFSQFITLLSVLCFQRKNLLLPWNDFSSEFSNHYCFLFFLLILLTFFFLFYNFHSLWLFLRKILWNFVCFASLSSFIILVISLQIFLLLLFLLLLQLELLKFHFT